MAAWGRFIKPATCVMERLHRGPQVPASMEAQSGARFKRPAASLRRRLSAPPRVNHANIVTIYEIAEYRRVNFIVMEYVVGDTLERVIPSGGLPVEQAVDYALQISAALAAAHAARNPSWRSKTAPGTIMV